MILHCSQKLAVKLVDLSATPLEETSPLGSWHGHLFTLDRRQCVMFCHDASRYVLFQSGLRKAHFAELGDRWFRPLYLATLAGLGCSTAQLRKAELALGPMRFDTAIDRSVQGSLRVPDRETSFSPADPTASVPACPFCQSSMVKRIAKKGSNAGNAFWGCSRYPACKGTRPV